MVGHRDRQLKIVLEERLRRQCRVLLDAGIAK